MALSLSRKPGQSIRIGRDVVVTVTETRSGRTRFRIDAPDDVRILRGELPVDDDAGNSRATNTDQAEVTPCDAAIANVDAESGRVVERPKPRHRAGSVLRMAPLAAQLERLTQSIRRRHEQRPRFGDSGPGLIPAC